MPRVRTEEAKNNENAEKIDRKMETWGTATVNRRRLYHYHDIHSEGIFDIKNMA